MMAASGSSKLTFILSERNERCIILNDFKFNKKRTDKKNVTKWVCRAKGCSAKCFTDSNDEVIKEDGTHNHEANLKKLSRAALTNACKRKATEDICERPAKIIPGGFLTGPTKKQNRGFPCPDYNDAREVHHPPRSGTKDPSLRTT
nr:PREDICTED: uncharacterized protein LOC109032728 [Bemisia tabaci]